MTDEKLYSVTRYGAGSKVVASYLGLNESETKRLLKMATGLPFGGWHHGYLADNHRHIIHVPPPLGCASAANETIIVDAEDA